MSDFGSSAVRQQRLAGELRRLRRRAHLTGKDVATRLGWSEAKLSRIENGLARVKRSDLDAFMDLYVVAEPHRLELVALAEESRQADLLEEFEGDLPEGHARFLAAEQEAEAMWNWEPQVVPGLLQVEDYTRALLLQLWTADIRKARGRRRTACGNPTCSARASFPKFHRSNCHSSWMNPSFSEDLPPHQ